MHVKRCNGNYKTSRKNEYGYNTLCIIGIQKMLDLGAGCGVNKGLFTPIWGVWGWKRLLLYYFYV